MKKFFVCILAFLLTFSVIACAETALSFYSVQDLLNMRNQIDQALIESAKGLDHSANNYNGLIYASNGSQIRINSYVGTDEHVTVPVEIDGVPVTMIAANAFENAKIKSVTLPEGITSIGEDAFRGSSIDGVIVLPKSLKDAGRYLILNSKVSGIVIQSDIKTSSWTFRSPYIKFVYITEGASPKLGSDTFDDSIEIAIIPASVTQIDDKAFVDCNKLTIVTPAGSYAEQYAQEHWIVCNTEAYDRYVSEYADYIR